MFVPGCMWQTMHWLEGMDLRELWRIGWPGWFLGIVGSMVEREARMSVDGVTG